MLRITSGPLHLALLTLALGAGTLALAQSETERRRLGDTLATPTHHERVRQLPRRGQSMQQVRNRWGEPQRRWPAVGDPPITRWEYTDFSVYFEYRHALHSVVHHPR
jgi:hypothetical protein